MKDRLKTVEMRQYGDGRDDEGREKHTAVGKCKRCGSLQYTKAMDLTIGRKKHTAVGILFRGGMTDPCELASAVGLNHLALNSARVRRISREAVIPRPGNYLAITRPVLCTWCQRRITQLPCIACKMKGMHGRYRKGRRRGRHIGQ